MTNQERNNNLFEEYKKKTYEELEELESKSDITYNDYVILCIARGVKQIEDGIPGIPADEVFSELLGDYNNRENNIFTTSKNRLNKY